MSYDTSSLCCAAFTVVQIATVNKEEVDVLFERELLHVGDEGGEVAEVASVYTSVPLTHIDLEGGKGTHE